MQPLSNIKTSSIEKNSKHNFLLIYFSESQVLPPLQIHTKTSRPHRQNTFISYPLLEFLQHILLPKLSGKSKQKTNCHNESRIYLQSLIWFLLVLIPQTENTAGKPAKQSKTLVNSFCSSFPTELPRHRMMQALKKRTPTHFNQP